MSQPTSQGLGWYGLDLALEPPQESYKSILHPLPAWYCDVTPCVVLVQRSSIDQTLCLIGFSAAYVGNEITARVADGYPLSIVT